MAMNKLIPLFLCLDQTRAEGDDPIDSHPRNEGIAFACIHQTSLDPLEEVFLNYTWLASVHNERTSLKADTARLSLSIASKEEESERDWLESSVNELTWLMTASEWSQVNGRE
jgi:hypothetical protein